MYGDFLLLDGDDGKSQRAERLALGDTAGRDEAWLRDALLQHPDLLPVRDIDPSFGPLIPLCRELRTPAGPIDAVFVNAHGRLTLVECKLWRNPESRRKVVAQVLDYARAISTWSYSDLQRQVSAATGRRGNVPFEVVRRVAPALQEHRFADSVAASMRQGRFLLLIAGDGIRQDVQSMAELINNNATLGFAFGLVEVALYGLDDGRLLVQPRIVAQTQTIQRTLVLIRDGQITTAVERTGGDEDDVVHGEAEAPAGNELGETARQAAYRRWWQPVLETKFDDPDQEPAKLFWPNNVRASLPWPGTWLLGYHLASGKVGVCTAGQSGADREMLAALTPELPAIAAELPATTRQDKDVGGKVTRLDCERRISDFPDEGAVREWISQTLNAFVNALRPRLKRLRREV